MLKPFAQWYEDIANEKLPENTIPATWFVERDLPMIVCCECCEMSMLLPSAWIDRQGYTYCRDCADIEA